MAETDMEMDSDRTISIETELESDESEETEEDEPGEKPIRPKPRDHADDPSTGYKVVTKAHDEEIAAEAMRCRGPARLRARPMRN